MTEMEYANFIPHTSFLKWHDVDHIIYEFISFSDIIRLKQYYSYLRFPYLIHIRRITYKHYIAITVQCSDCLIFQNNRLDNNQALIRTVPTLENNLENRPINPVDVITVQWSQEPILWYYESIKVISKRADIHYTLI